MPTAWAGMPTLRDPRVAIAAILLAYVILGLTVLGFNRSPLQVVQTVATAVLLDMALHANFGRRSPPPGALSTSVTGL